MAEGGAAAGAAAGVGEGADDPGGGGGGPADVLVPTAVAAAVAVASGVFRGQSGAPSRMAGAGPSWEEGSPWVVRRARKLMCRRGGPRSGSRSRSMMRSGRSVGVALVAASDGRSRERACGKEERRPGGGAALALAPAPAPVRPLARAPAARGVLSSPSGSSATVDLPDRPDKPDKPDGGVLLANIEAGPDANPDECAAARSSPAVGTAEAVGAPVRRDRDRVSGRAGGCPLSCLGFRVRGDTMSDDGEPDKGREGSALGPNPSPFAAEASSPNPRLTPRR